MSKLAHSDQETMDIIESINLYNDIGEEAFPIMLAHGFKMSLLPVDIEKHYRGWAMSKISTDRITEIYGEPE